MDISHSAPRLCQLLLLFNLALRPTCFLLLLSQLFPLFSVPSPSVAVPLWNPINFIRSLPPLPIGSAAHLDAACTCRPLASTARPCAPRHVPVSAVFPVLVRSPLYCPRPAPRSLSSPGCFTRFRSLRVPAKYSPSYPLNIGIFQFWCPCRVDFCKN